MPTNNASSSSTSEPVASFCQRLQELRLSFGASVRDIERKTKELGVPYPRSTIQAKLAGVHKPDWPFVAAFVQACHECGGSSEEPDLKSWHQKYLTMMREHLVVVRAAADDLGDPERGRFMADLTDVLETLPVEDLTRVARESGIDIPVPDGEVNARLVIQSVRSVGQFIRLIDGCSEGGGWARSWQFQADRMQAALDRPEAISIVVVFKSTGERVLVSLPADMEIESAAKHIVGEIFLRELPAPRRALYITDTNFSLTHNGTEYRSGTLQSVGVREGDEVSVTSMMTYPWAHNIDYAAALREADMGVAEVDPHYCLMGNVRSTVVARMRAYGLTLCGGPGGEFMSRRTSPIYSDFLWNEREAG
ncbi:MULTISPECIES: hypothetical protein [unclassified Streptomyces]|uniref:hypothetical protein n=1 Tax=unclassified Streptomyces TaxID=2593676 RepID=UPI00114D39F5|nr:MULTISPECIES: hypothetical protein [unclassified Streptomyces]MYQ86459.1 hypothetical protein [Streptomyces sp. SID4936]